MLNADERRYATQRLHVAETRAKTVRNGLADHFCRRAAQLQALALQTPGAAVPARRGIVQVGSYEARKGIRSAVAATTRVLEDRPELRMAYLGTTHPAETTLNDYPAALRDRVTAVPRFDNTDLPRLLADYQIFTMPSIYEGFGIAPLEAMACGVVPIVTDIAGPAEYVNHGVNGLVVPVDDPVALEQAIRTLIEDDALYAALQAGGLETALRFGWDEVAASRLSDYELFGKAKRRRGSAGDRQSGAGRPARSDLGLSSRAGEHPAGPHRRVSHVGD